MKLKLFFIVFILLCDFRGTFHGKSVISCSTIESNIINQFFVITYRKHVDFSLLPLKSKSATFSAIEVDENDFGHKIIEFVRFTENITNTGVQIFFKKFGLSTRHRFVKSIKFNFVGDRYLLFGKCKSAIFDVSYYFHLKFIGQKFLHFKNKKIGFDLDDTLIFSSPGFVEARKKLPEINHEEYMRLGEIGITYSLIKKQTAQLLSKLTNEGNTVYIITGRLPANPATVTEYIYREFGVPPSRVFFEPNGKLNRIKTLNLDVFFGDSDNDMVSALKNGIRAVRVLRVPFSNNRDFKTKKFTDYNPGMFGEEILENSYF